MSFQVPTIDGIVRAPRQERDDADTLLFAGVERDGDAYRALRGRRAVRVEADGIDPQRAPRPGVPPGQSRGQGAEPDRRWRDAGLRGRGDAVVPRAALSRSGPPAAIRRHRRRGAGHLMDVVYRLDDPS